MTDGIVIDHYVLTDLDEKHPKATTLIHGAISGNGLRVWIPRYCFTELLDHHDHLATLLAGLQHLVPGRLMIGDDDPVYLRAIRNFAAPHSIKDPLLVPTVFDAVALRWPIVTSNPRRYKDFDDVRIIGYGR